MVKFTIDALDYCSLLIGLNVREEPSGKQNDSNQTRSYAKRHVKMISESENEYLKEADPTAFKRYKNTESGELILGKFRV